ncbi:MAG: PAS domain S-box protein [Deltaproteobacteria bacterium]|nr:PAS domain S-box protein [Deltaproteobacteria bacterium]
MPTQSSLYPILKTRIKWLMVFRVALVIIFIGTSIWFQFKQTSPFQSTLYPIYAILIVTCFLTILYAIVFKWIANVKLFAYLQIFGDIFLITATLYVTGGSESLLSFLYFLSIISASILLSRRGGFYAASASSIAYGILVNLDFYKWLPQGYKSIIITGPGYERGDILATVMLNIIGFYTVAFLTGYLAERTLEIERELEEKKIDFKKLEVLNKYIVENINSGILTIDNNERITSFNRAAERITGYTLGEVYGNAIDMIFIDLMKVQAYSLAPPDNNPAYFRIERPFRRRDGKELFLGFAVSPIREGGHIIIFQDLTRFKEIEEELRRVDKLRALGELAAGMAHEVRNPLASISGSIQVLKDSLAVDNESEHLMDIVIRETDRLNALITDFLLFAKPAAKMAEINLSEVIHNTLNMFRNSPESKGIDIYVKLKDNLIIEGDGRQLKQVFWNLFLNAGHAMPAGGRLEIRGQGIYSNPEITEPRNPELAEITVSDTGNGIAADDINNIFDPFFTTEDFGTGLGLAVVHRIIEGHKGKIEVKSKKGEGTSFKIILPKAVDSKQ